MTLDRSLKLLLMLALFGGCASEDEADPPTEQSEPPITDDGGTEPEPEPYPSCDGDPGPTSDIRATAPWSVGDHHLGRPVDQQFETIPGEKGGSLFDDAEMHDTSLDIAEHQYFLVENSHELQANGTAWGVTVTADGASQKRYASFRAYEVAFVREIDDGAKFNVPPEGAAYYVSRIYYGHSFEVVVSGEASTFHAGVRARFTSASGSIEAFAEEYNLEVSVFGRGLEPRGGEAIFAKTAEEIEEAYSAAGDPVPIFVDYKRIPDTCASDVETYDWLEPTRVTVNLDGIDVYRDGSIGQDNWSLDAQCKLNGNDIELDDPVIWDHRTGVGSKCESGMGPNGDDDFCHYDLSWSAVFELIEGDEIRCGVTGIAHHDNHIIPYSSFSYTVLDQNDPVSDRFGAGDGDTEYWMYYSLSFQDPEPDEQE